MTRCDPRLKLWSDHDGRPDLRRGCGALHVGERCPLLTWPVNEASISCRMVRYALKLYSSEALESMARARGLSEATIQRLKRCAS